MSVNTIDTSATSTQPSPVADDITAIAYKTYDELYRMSRGELDNFQLSSALRRIEEQRPLLAALREQADSAGVTANDIKSLNDLVPLLFNHGVYKSYPMALLEKSRFDLLTKWLSRMTTVDISGVDTSRCEGIDHWMETLERETCLQMFHTTGTSGKLSFIPRTTLEADLFMQMYLKMFTEGFGKPGMKLGGKDGARLPIIYPSARHGRYVAQRLIKYLTEHIAPSPADSYTISEGTLSADLVSLSGRVRVAQAKGEVSKMRLSDSQRVALKRYLEEQASRGQQMTDFFTRVAEKLRGQRVFLFSQAAFLLPAAQGGIARNLTNVFAPDSPASTGGGGKDIKLPPDWLDTIKRFTGIKKFTLAFGMTEANGFWPACEEEGNYHIPPYIIPFVLDPISGEPLPRTGKQTGRFATLDLTAQHYWGGIITGDLVTIDWDHGCSCGRTGPYMHPEITRYDASITGDDKITCSATVDNTDAALQKLLAG